MDTAGGSTAGGILQTAQRVGNAFGAAVISATFYAQVARGGSLTRASAHDRHVHYADAYATGLAVSVGFALIALALAVRAVRRTTPPARVAR